MKQSPVTPWLLAALMLFVCTACVRLVPVPDPRHTVASDRYGSTQQVGGLQVTVRSAGWTGDAPLDRLAPYVTALYVEIRNNGEQSVTFKVGDAVLVDESDVLYRPLAPQRLEALLRRPALARGDLVEPYVYPYDNDLAATLSSLTSGDVAPGTAARGAMYFQRIAAHVREITLRLTLAGQVREFVFRVQ
jgi:hypothetical protein